MNYRIFVEKKPAYQTEAQSLQHDFVHNLHLNITHLRLINIYDLFNIEKSLLEKSKYQIFGEPVTDNVFENIDLQGKKYIAIEYLPGQFDQRADSAIQCLSLIDPTHKVNVKSGKLIIIEGNISQQDIITIKKYFINEIEAREKNLEVLDDSIQLNTEQVYEIEGFINFSDKEIKAYRKSLSLAMSDEDLIHVRNYFAKEEKRNPTITEIKVLDTYWSDHCRHTTFETELQDITFPKGKIGDLLLKTFSQYLEMRQYLGRDEKPVTLMDMATINARYELKNGNLKDWEISEENNACSIFVDVDIDGETEKWLLMFKNETHNHPTEIEPFGGASTCIGGAIRDPLSGRSFVYQAMRVTGAGDITQPIEKTLSGKLPQRIISKTAAHGYSSYGNQIGLATTHVREIYHPGYVAKRMEVGAVVGAVKASLVRRETPQAGDVVILLGGKTGRDGIGGATGSSKEHHEKSLELCAAEVQKGNAPEERKIQRLFRNPEVTKLIKKSNDFGAGGVSVAIGELADGLLIDLDKIPTKYKGLNGTELAISESQERMSVVVDAKDVDQFITLAHTENIEATIIAHITDNARLTMIYHGKKIVDMSRAFINTNGVRQKTNIAINTVDSDNIPFNRNIEGTTFKEKLFNNLSDLNVAMQKGMIEMFDSTIGASTVLMPFGGKYQLTETQASVQKLPVLNGNTHTTSVMSFGYNPYLASWSPYHGAIYAVIESMAKIVATGASYKHIRFSFQEYFERLNKDPYRWGKPTAALLGTIEILQQFQLASIGGKDSMSGSFKELDVPPTLISFAITTANAPHIISPEFKQVGHYIYLIKHIVKDCCMPDVSQLKHNFEYIHQQIKLQKIVSAYTIGMGGISEAICKMCYGNKLGVNITTDEDLFDLQYGSFVVETTEKLDFTNAILLGKVTDKDIVINDNMISVEEALQASMNTFEDIYPTQASSQEIKKLEIINPTCHSERSEESQLSTPPSVLLPIFPGTNCDYDMAKAFEREGAISQFFVFRNTLETDIQESINDLAESINHTHIFAISGGFSAGDEPDGSGKFIANVLGNQHIAEALEKLLQRGGLILGVCNGFQALVKSGLLPYGKTGSITENSPTLFRNDINRHVSKIVNVRVSSIQSPWLSSFNVGGIYSVPLSHGEGKFVVSEEDAKLLFENGQVAFQYCDFEGQPTMNPLYNPNGSYYAIEGIISKCGRILGRMGHCERAGQDLLKNIHGNTNQNIFKNAVNYFKK